MTLYQLSVFIENKSGRLSEIISILAEAGVDIRALSIADTTDFGILRLIVNDVDLAVKVLGENNMAVSKTEVIGIKLQDEAGSLANFWAVLLLKFSLPKTAWTWNTPMHLSPTARLTRVWWSA